MKNGKIIQVIKNRYVITAFLFIIWIGFIDHNNLLKRGEVKRENKELKQVKKEYKEKIKKTRGALQSLDDDEQLEKLAREKYLMKKENEDIFIVTE